MTRIELREQRISRWTALLQEAQTSGLTIKEWCKSNGIQESTFHYWKRQLHPKEASPTPEQPPSSSIEPPIPCFAELDIRMEKESSPFVSPSKLMNPEFLIQIRDFQVAVNPGFTEEDLMKLFRVASHVQ